MPGTTQESRWRLLVGAAPLAIVAIFFWAAAQGEIDVARWPTLRALLAAVAAIGTGVAWWTARQLRLAPGMTVARASRLAQAGRLAGPVAMRGRARALPDAVPLVSPDGELCVWYEHRDVDAPAGRASVRPFVLEDERGGQCVVLVAGAEVSGRAHGAAGVGERVGAARERLLRAGDRVLVTGRFVGGQTESLALQDAATALAAHAELMPGVLRGGDPPPLRDLRAAARIGAPFVAALPRLAAGLPLPAIAVSDEQRPVAVRIGSDQSEGAVYGLLALADALVLVVLSSLALHVI